MPSKFKAGFVLIAALAAFAMSGCQDHHFVSYDKMGPLPEPKPLTQEERAAAQQQQQQQQPSSMTGEAQPYAREPMGAAAPSSPAAGEFIIGGKIELAPVLIGKIAPDWVLYVIVRPEAGGPPLAAIRLANVKFPIGFSINSKDAMMGEVKPGMKISVEARYDSDGDPMTKKPEDLFGKQKGEITAGAKDALIVLDKQG